MIKRIAFFVFDGVTFLDLIGGYDALRRVASMRIDPGVTHRIIGTTPEVADDSGLVVKPDGVYEDLADFDLLYVPGGWGTRALMGDTRCIEYLRDWGTRRPVVSACTGALLLGAAGHLHGLRATTHHRAFDLLTPYCGEVVRDQRIVDEGRVVTAGGVASALDLGLYLVEKYWGRPAREQIAAQMEYRHFLSPMSPLPAGA